jgi:hypothetical protein
MQDPRLGMRLFVTAGSKATGPALSSPYRDARKFPEDFGFTGLSSDEFDDSSELKVATVFSSASPGLLLTGNLCSELGS